VAEEVQDASLAAEGTEVTGFASFGVKMYIGANRPEVIERLPSLLPPGWAPSPVMDADHRMAIMGNDNGTYEVNISGAAIAHAVPLELALEVLESQVHARIALHSKERVFVHAGVVAHRGRAILLPGTSFAGKTTLVAALVRAGATYYSDEFAPLDAEGLVHPYAKPLSLRGADDLQHSHAVESIGGVAGDKPLPVALIAKTIHRAGAQWRPRVLSAGEGALALLAQAVSAQARPEDATRAIARAVDGAVVIASERADAAEVAPLLLAELEARAA